VHLAFLQLTESFLVESEHLVSCILGGLRAIHADCFVLRVYKVIRSELLGIAYNIAVLVKHHVVSDFAISNASPVLTALALVEVVLPLFGFFAGCFDEFTKLGAAVC
jgi:hypothetical protein